MGAYNRMSMRDKAICEIVHSTVELNVVIIHTLRTSRRALAEGGIACR